jgi:hypothetical protein
MAAVRVTRTGNPHVETTYRLYRSENRVEFENVLDESLMPYVPYAVGYRAYMVTLPFDIHGFQIRSETTTRFLDPLTDGFSRTSVFDWHNVEHTLAFWDPRKGVLHAIDAVDALSFERLSTFPPASFSTGHAVLLPRLKDHADEYEFEGGSIGAYEIEPGTSPIFRSTHHVRATPPAFDPVSASRFGFEALTPLEGRFLARRPGNLPDTQASFLRVDGPGILPYTLKGAETGGGFTLRMTDLTGIAGTARVSSDVLALGSPARVEHDEEGGTPLASDGAGFLVPVGAYETATVRFAASPAWSPLVLRADKDAPVGAVHLTWTGGVPPYTIRRAGDAAFTVDVATPLDEGPVTTFDDPVLDDGRTWFYLVK